MLQRRDLTIGNFYGIWIQTKNKLSRINSTLSMSILNEMKTREVKLLENDIFISGNTSIFNIVLVGVLRFEQYYSYAFYFIWIHGTSAY